MAKVWHRMSSSSYIFAKTDPCSSRAVSLRQLSFSFHFWVGIWAVYEPSVSVLMKQVLKYWHLCLWRLYHVSESCVYQLKTFHHVQVLSTPVCYQRQTYWQPMLTWQWCHCRHTDQQSTVCCICLAAGFLKLHLLVSLCTDVTAEVRLALSCVVGWQCSIQF